MDYVKLLDTTGFYLSFSFSATIIGLSGIIAIGSIIQANRSRRFYGRYGIMFLASIFPLIPSAVVVSYLNGGPVLNKSFWSSSILFSNIFLPLLYCLFFEICRTLVNVSTATTETTATIMNQQSQQPQEDQGKPMTPKNNSYFKSFYNAPKHMHVSYFSYLWTFIMIVVIIALCASFGDAYDPYNFSQLNTASIVNMSNFIVYGNWVYVLLVGLQLFYSYQYIRPFIISLSIYLFVVFINTIGSTVAHALLTGGTCEAEDMCGFIASVVYYVTGLIIGLLNLVYAMVASTRLWPPPPRKSQPYQQHYMYAPAPVMGATFATIPQQQPLQQQYVMQQPQQVFATGASLMTGSSSQVYQQQPQQPIIVQLPINQQVTNDNNQQHNYPIVQVQQQNASVSSIQVPHSHQ